MKELITEALTDKLPEVLSFVDEQLETVDCPMKTQMQIDIAVEEIFVNIANYAYADEKGSAAVQVEFTTEPQSVSITFRDSGIPYDPLAKPDPDISLSAEERQIGGLGIFMVKKSMDDIKYQYLDGQNILTLTKGW
jgi:anti-sigma regulatory factor (Ser/Thr protein kinase)